MFEKLTQFIPVLEVERIGEWVAVGDSTHIEYWDVVFRFCDAVEAFCEENPDYTEFAADDADDKHRLIAKLLHAVRIESQMPGLLYGYIANGTVNEWLSELKKLDKK